MHTEVSNVIVSGKGRRYRRNWQERGLTSADVHSLFASRAEAAVEDVISFADRPAVPAEVVEGDARNQHFHRHRDVPHRIRDRPRQ